MLLKRKLVNVLVLLSFPAGSFADVIVNTGNPDGMLGAVSRQGNGFVETETGDDFNLNVSALITGGSFYGLIGPNVSLSDISDVTVEIYRVFPNDSDTVRTQNVPSRLNSPSDVEFDSRDS